MLGHEKLHRASPDTNSPLVYLTASVISSLIETLPSGTAYFVEGTLIAIRLLDLVKHEDLENFQIKQTKAPYNTRGIP